MPDHAEEDELTLIENAPPSRPDARLGVPATAALLVADVVGTGVLALPRNVRAVGLPFGLAFLVAQVPLNQLAGAMLDRTQPRPEAGGAPLATTANWRRARGPRQRARAPPRSRSTRTSRSSSRTTSSPRRARCG